MSTPREMLHFDTLHVGRRVLLFDELSSTNDTAAGEEPGTVVVADFQSAGRGQYGRVWQAKPGTSLLLSVVVTPPPELRRPVILTAWAAVAVADAVLRLTGQQSKIKWPNDLLVRGKKVCGILIEQRTGTAPAECPPPGSTSSRRPPPQGGRYEIPPTPDTSPLVGEVGDSAGVGGWGVSNSPPAATVVGIGLNLNQTAAEFAAAGLPDATSLVILAGQPIDPRVALAAVVRHLDDEYDRLVCGERVPLEADWKWRIGLLGRQVVAERSDGSTVTGRLRDLSFDGIELEADGGMRILKPEEVRHLSAA